MKQEQKVVSPVFLKDVVRKLIASASISLHYRYLQELKARIGEEDSPNARWVLHQLLENADIARRENLPLCQDTGYVLVFLGVGKDICLPPDTQGVIDEAVHQVYGEALLRASMVSHPLQRVNTGDNTPALVHIEQKADSGLEIDVMLKGAGSENASLVKMLSPSEGERGILQFVLQTLRKTAWNACPPLVLGLGVGGTMEKACYLAKKAVLNWAKGKEMTDWERDLMREVNKLGIGPGGVGGKLTCLGVSVETAPCHIATLPVALNVQCYAMRIATLRLARDEIEGSS